MYASRHAVFAGAGELPKELRDVLRKRHGHALAELQLREPTLLAAFDTAADAEKAAGQLDRLGLGALVVGPEQPPPTDGWFVATALTKEAHGWTATGPSGTRLVLPAQVSSVAILQWRPDVGTPDRALLLRGDAEPPLYACASRLSAAAGGAGAALKLLVDLAEDVGTHAAPGLRVRERRMTPARFEQLALDGDRVALALAAVDALDRQPATAPRRLDAAKAPVRSAEANARDSAVARRLRAASLVSLAAALGVAATAALLLGTDRVLGLALATALGAWASLRLAWAQHLARRAGHGVGWPVSEQQAGRAPTLLGLATDGLLLGAAGAAARFGGATVAGLAPLVAGAALVGAGLSLHAALVARDELP